MSLRRNRRRRRVKRAAKGAVEDTRRWTGLGVGAAAIAALAAFLARRRRGRREELGYGPPNESAPSHETLAPAREEAASK